MTFEASRFRQVRRSPGVGVARRVAGPAALLLAGVLGACVTPTRSTLDPSAQDGGSPEHTAARALEVCRVQRGPEEIPPHPFTTDGCSLWPDAAWVACCVTHDMAYWCGGSADDRARADRELRACVSRHSACGMGPLMGAGVRLGGVPWIPAPWRWGYGWDYPAGYAPE